MNPSTRRMVLIDHRGRRIERIVDQRINIEDFLGTAVYPWLVMAANPHLSAPDIARWLGITAEEHPGAGRPLSWIRKRRWMTQHTPRHFRDADGQESHALTLMAAHPSLSLRKLAALLKGEGVSRSREWLRRRRVAAMGDMAVTHK